jgi:hypothetical protein
MTAVLQPDTSIRAVTTLPVESIWMSNRVTGSMFDIEATVTETGPTVLKLTGDWPVDWLRETGTRTMEIQRELLHAEILEIPSVPTERAQINGDRGNWPKLHVGNRVVVRCFFPGE